MNGLDYDHFCQLVRARSGLVLTPEKAYLVSSRLASVARSAGMPDWTALLAHLRSGAPESLIQSCVDAMATHETFFFRDKTPFDQLAQIVLPELIEGRRASQSLRIWCAACSSGQEPYSVAMLLEEHAAQLAGRRLEIVATDMSEAILDKARNGAYSDFEVQRGLSDQQRNRWFVRDGAHWKIAPSLRKLVRFQSHNLLNGASNMGVFDVIFCRNVLIYFDVPKKCTILAELAKALANDGALFLGSAETVIGLSDAFELAPGARGLYRPTARAIARAS